LEQRRFLRAGHEDRLTGSRNFTKAFEFGMAKLAALDDNHVFARTAHRLAIKRHAVFAGTDQDVARPFGHPTHLPFTSLARVLTAKGPLIASLSHLIPAAAGLGLG